MHFLERPTSGIMEGLSLAACKINPPKVSVGRLNWRDSRPVFAVLLCSQVVSGR